MGDFFLAQSIDDIAVDPFSLVGGESGADVVPEGVVLGTDIGMLDEREFVCVVVVSVVDVGCECLVGLVSFVEGGGFPTKLVDQPVAYLVVEVGAHGAFVGLVLFICSPHGVDAFGEKFVVWILDAEPVQLVVDAVFVLFVDGFESVGFFAEFGWGLLVG